MFGTSALWPTLFVRSQMKSRTLLSCAVLVVSSLLVSARKAEALQYLVCSHGQAVIYEDVYYADGTYAGFHIRSYAGGCSGSWWCVLSPYRPSPDVNRTGLPKSEQIVKILDKVSAKDWSTPSDKPLSEETLKGLQKLRQGSDGVYVDPAKLPAYIAKSLLASAKEKR